MQRYVVLSVSHDVDLDIHILMIEIHTSCSIDGDARSNQRSLLLMHAIQMRKEGRKGLG